MTTFHMEEHISDRELLEYAAKAAGLYGAYDTFAKTFVHAVDVKGGASYAEWNPLASDGDALRLAVKLVFRLDILQPDIICVDQKGRCTFQVNLSHLDHCATTRRAIVRAAAIIGKEMK